MFQSLYLIYGFLVLGMVGMGGGGMVGAGPPGNEPVNPDLNSIDFFPPALPGSTPLTTLNNLLGDGCDYGVNGASAGMTVTPNTFPYLQTPWDGQEFSNDYFQSPRHP